MINSEDTKTIKELVMGALLQAYKRYPGKEITITIPAEIKETTNTAFDIVINEMENGGI